VFYGRAIGLTAETAGSYGVASSAASRHLGDVAANACSAQSSTRSEGKGLS